MLCRKFSFLLLFVCINIVQSSYNENLLNQIAEERKEDTEAHECRSCKNIQIDAASNCPPIGYECDEDLPIISHVEEPRKRGECSHLRCGDANSILAVNGNIVNKVHCRGRKWWTPDNNVTESAVCACKCGSCNQLPAEFFEDENNKNYEPLNISPPSPENTCALAVCQNGAKGMSEDQEYDEPVSFICTGDGTWKYVRDETRNHKFVACYQGHTACKEMKFSTEQSYCQASGALPKPNTYECSKPDFDESSNTIYCSATQNPNSFRRTDNVEKIFNPLCKSGKWFDGDIQVSDTTETVCLNCFRPTFWTSPGAANASTTGEKLYCPPLGGGYLQIHSRKGGIHGAEDIQVNASSVECNKSTFKWEAIGAAQPISLEEILEKGDAWAAVCMDDLP